MMHKYELWHVTQRDLPNKFGGGFQTVDIAASYDTKIELAKPDEAHILALLFDMEYVSQQYERDGDTEIPIKCEKQLNGNWRIDAGIGVIEPRLVV